MPAAKQKKLNQAPIHESPGIAEQHLLDEYSDVPVLRNNFLNGHVLFSYINTEENVTKTGRTALQLISKSAQNLPSGVSSKFNLAVQRFVRCTLHKYKTLTNKREFQEFASICGERFKLHLGPRRRKSNEHIIPTAGKIGEPKQVSTLYNMEDIADVGMSGSSVKRVRKKSAKVREMEEAEAFEKKMFKSPPKSATAPVTSTEGALVATPAATKKNRTKSVSAPRKITAEDEPQTEVPYEILNSSNVSFLTPPKHEAGDEEPVEVPVSLPNHSEPAPAPVEDIPPKKPKPKKKSKTPKDPGKTEKIIPPPVSIPESANALYDVYSSITVKQEDETGLKLKLCLNSPKEVHEEPMDFQSDDEQPAIWPSFPSMPANQDPVIVKLKKKKSKKHKNNETVNGDALNVDNSSVSPTGLEQATDMEVADDAKHSLVSIKMENEAPEPIVIKPLKTDVEIERAPSPLGPSHLETQLVIDTDSVPVKSDKSKKKRKRKHPPVVDESLPESKAIKHEQEEGYENEENEEGACPVNLYSNTAAMALKLKTSSEKRVSGSAKERKNRKDKKKKKFRRNGPTAYTMFCNNYRSKVVAENPGSDFAQTSKRLGEIWQCLPAKEKMVWKRKARQCLNKMQKEATAQQTAKSLAPAKEDPTRPPPIIHRLGKNNTSKQNALYRGGRKGISKKIIQPEPDDAEAGSSTLLGQLLTSQAQEEEGEGAMSPPPQPKQLILKADPTTPCQPIDVAAHLKLLGDSLITIGNRLQEHRVPIAVQGSLSVLLDSSICAMGALVSLTNQVPELQTIPSSVHSRNLDNIAYIMPGIG